MNIAEEIAAGRAVLSALQGVADSALVGSAMYMPENAVGDVDFAVMLVEGNHAIDWSNALIAYDPTWQACSEYDSASGTWYSLRRENLNLMVTHDRAFFDGYRLAMEVCKVLRLERKEDRIAVCQVVRDRLPADVVRPSSEVFA